MQNKIYTVAILGVGSRGADAYGKLINRASDKFNIVALCDMRQERLNRFQKEFGVEASCCFTDEDVFFQEKRADLLVIATQDADHVRHAIKAFSLGYDVLMEKPITDKKEECERLLEVQKQYGCKALVCHVLRYAPAFVKVGELLKSGTIGRLVAINALERVGYFHQAHSYVRGNWRDTEKSTPMILAKCCHDLDLLQYYANSKCKSVSSVGDLTYFTKENALEGATERCVDCPHKNTCPYSALGYIKHWEEGGKPTDVWPFNVIAFAPVTKEKLENAITQGNYGRCVFRCDNNAVDHQLTDITFENGVKASLMMTAFTAFGGRRMHFFGTLGEIVLDEFAGEIQIYRFERGTEIINLKSLSEGGYDHGGGDTMLIENLYDMLCGNSTSVTSLESSVESHLIGICAEESRKADGKLVFVHG